MLSAISARKLMSRGPRVYMEPLEARLLLSAAGSATLAITTTAVSDASETGSPSGLSPAMIQQAYDLNDIVFTTGGVSTSATGAGETIAIVDAYADPDIVSDLKTFDSNFGITNNDAGGNFVLTVDTPEGSPITNAGWAAEESLDVETAHAIAPEADIVLVEADSASIPQLTSAVQYAADLTGVVAISMSWGDSPEFAGETAYDSDFITPVGHAGVTFVAASGDDDAPNFPSTVASVLAVGGTTLTVDNAGDYESETAWADSGGGFSPYELTTKPDVAYDADPATGFLVYDSLPYQGVSGWQVVGGTSAGSPQWAAIIALADQGLALRGFGSLNGATQTIPDLDSFSSSDFHYIGSGNTGLGSPVGEKIISDLVGGGITSTGTPSTPSQSPTELAFAEQPTNTSAGSTISAVTVDIDNSNASVNTGANSDVTLSIASGPSGATLSGTVTVQADDGIATFNNLSIDSAGTFTLEATDSSLTPATSDSFTISSSSSPTPTPTPVAAATPAVRTFLFNGVPLSPIAQAAQEHNEAALAGDVSRDAAAASAVAPTSVVISAVSTPQPASAFAASSPVDGPLSSDTLAGNFDSTSQAQDDVVSSLLTSDPSQDLFAGGSVIAD
jgi:hypothetical protein